MELYEHLKREGDDRLGFTDHNGSNGVYLLLFCEVGYEIDL